jgi:hypothetical protein
MRWLFMLISTRHRAAGLGAVATGVHALIHPTEALAIPRALRADFGAFPTGMFVARRGDEHEVRRRPAHFGAGHHQPEVRRRNVLAAHFQAVVHGRAKTRFIAIQASVDAAFRVF